VRCGLLFFPDTGKMEIMNPVYLSETCLQWSFGETLDEPTVRTTLCAFRQLQRAKLPGVLDIVPAYNKLAVHFEAATDVESAISTLLSKAKPAKVIEGTLHTLPAYYDGEDLPQVAQHCGLSIEEVISRHSTPVYLVAMIGFQPHFPYLFGLDPSLETSRLKTPRLQVPAGAIAIGGAQTGIYPSVSPGGWHLIGRTDPTALKALQPGDQIQFEVRT